MIDFSNCDMYQAKLDSFRPFPKETLQSLREYYRIGLTYSSNAIEGNSLTESETKVVIEDGLTVRGKPLRDIFEAVGHAKAYDFIWQLIKIKELTEKQICQVHRLFYEAISSEQAGVYRTVPVFISGSKYRLPTPGSLPAKMKQFCGWYNHNEKILHPVEFAALVHLKFVFIHPFVDGNGRVARLLMNMALLRSGFPISVVPPILRSEYIQILEVSHRRPELFIQFIRDRIIESQRELLRLLSDFQLGPSDGGTIREESGTINISNGTRNLDTRILSVISHSAGINAIGLVERLGIPRRTLMRHLKKLSDAGQIKFIGARKNGGYFLQKMNK